MRSAVLAVPVAVLALLFQAGCGGGGGGSNNGGGGGGGGVTVPPVPAGLTATAGNGQVSLTWNVSSGATSYNVKRSTTTGGPYTQIASPTTTSYTDTTVTNGVAYYYVVSAVNSAGESANSSQATATPTAPATQVSVTVDTLVDRHDISPFIYGGNPNSQDSSWTNTRVTDSGMTVVRWGGNATTAYNWQTHTSNSANDWWFTDYTYPMLGTADSTQFVSNVIAAGSNPIMTIGMVDWVSKATSANDSGQVYSFSVAKYGAQCTTRPDGSDAGNGVQAGANCATNPIYITGNDPHDAYVPLLDTAASPCSGNCAGAVNRQEWTTALAAAFNTSATALHFYDMDNEADIWGGTHRDLHPNPASYDELRDVYLRVARNVKSWDPAAVRLGPVSTGWWQYWNGADGADKGRHGNADLLPWWLNEVYWRDQIDGTRSVDVFDVHAYPDGPDTSSLTQAQKQALSLRIYRDYWDPSYVSESHNIFQEGQGWATSIQPNRTIPFRIPRLRAMTNMIYPGTPLSITEWSASFASEADFSTALADADAYGILGRENVYLATRWNAPAPANPNYQALKLYTKANGASGFGSHSVSATHNADPNLFSVYAALQGSDCTLQSGCPLTIMVVNKDPNNAAQVTFALNNYSPSQVSKYTLSQASPSSIVTSAAQAWNATQTFQPYTATLLIITGNQSSLPGVEWDLNPDVVQVAAAGSVTLAPRLLTPTGALTLTNAQFDSNSPCSIQNGGSLNITTSQVTPGAPGSITATAGSGPGFCRFTVTGQGTGVTTTQHGWIVVGNPAALLSNTTGSATGAPGSQVTLKVQVTPSHAISPPVCQSVPQCGPTVAAGASLLFTTDAGSFSGGAYPATAGQRMIVKADANGVANVTFTFPATSGTAHVTVEGPYALGHPVITFNEVSTTSHALAGLGTDLPPAADAPQEPVASPRMGSPNPY